MDVGLQTIGIAAGVLALAFLVAMRLFWRMPDSPGRHWLLLFGIAVLPGFALGLGTISAMDDAKHPDFCGSCHVMQPFIADLKNPESETLAAVHYQNRYILEHQCYTCHTDYTFFGPFEAKLAGLRHLWNYQTGNYTEPIRIRTPYRTANCLHCHGESKAFLTQHEDVAPQLAGGDVTCLDCHRPAHPDGEARR